jgi:peptidyl-prolyl cis-trans isomerase SurA
MIMSQLRQRDVLARVNVTQREIDAFLVGEGAGALDDREFNVGHIMLRVESDASPEQVDRVRRLADELVRRARDGEDFAALAVAHSQGQQALEGGSLGWRRATQLPAVFAERVVGMQPGAVSDVIRTPGALHVVKLHDARGGGERMEVEQTRARHILIRTNPVLDDARAHARLAELRQRVIDGEAEFGALARRHSDDPGSAINDGDLGWLEPGQTVPAFEEAMAQLAPGEVSEPFASEYGWHLVQVVERRRHDGTEQQRVAQARHILRERKGEEQVELWLRRLRDEAFIDNRLEG